MGHGLNINFTGIFGKMLQNGINTYIMLLNNRYLGTILPNWSTLFTVFINFMQIISVFNCFRIILITCTLLIMCKILIGVHVGERANKQHYFFIDRVMQQGYDEQ